jgi:hypothetical protein
MSIYKDLNDINVDIEQFEIDTLTDSEMKRWEKRVLRKVGKHRPSRMTKYLGFTAAVIAAIGITINTGVVTLASIPFVGGIIEEFIGRDEQVDFAAYKTAIGATAENEYGKMTLNEVLIDGGRLIMSSTYEPADGVKFNYKMHPLPKVQLNGQNLGTQTGGQSVEVHDRMFTIYNYEEISDIPLGERVHFHIVYDHLDFEKPMEQPWVFDIEVPTDQLASNSQTIVFDDIIELGKGQTIRIDKMIVTPISAILYYDWTEESNHIAFKIVSDSGEEIMWNSASVDEAGSSNRYEATLDLVSEQYYLVPYELSANRNATDPGVVPEVAIPIRP